MHRVENPRVFHLSRPVRKQTVFDFLERLVGVALGVDPAHRHNALPPLFDLHADVVEIEPDFRIDQLCVRHLTSRNREGQILPETDLERVARDDGEIRLTDDREAWTGLVNRLRTLIDCFGADHTGNREEQFLLDLLLVPSVNYLIDEVLDVGRCRSPELGIDEQKGRR